MRDPSREHELEQALAELYGEWWRALEPNVNTDKFWQMIDPNCKTYRGGVWMVRHLLYAMENEQAVKPQRTGGSSVEELVLSGDWDDLFDANDKLAAKRRLG